ncbi:hypothetical protein SAMN02745857_01792 [Andreprevotia lacus DSM 23236]|uniref:Uncharacterized protein n=2 Tax=Andreprevotia TaxID=397275 RepID=A0A1W1XKE6_9NEIS|nr:hypothetical protein SAMN02745857_01792 [Andreprevotia lacus DSM 23236]
MRVTRLSLLLSGLAVVMTLGACGSPYNKDFYVQKDPSTEVPKPGTTPLPYQPYGKDVHAISLDIKQRMVFFKDGVVCPEPSPDAISAAFSELDLNGTVENAAAKGIIGAAYRSGENAGYVGLRTTSVQLLRDSLTGICLAYLNTGDKTEYQIQLRRHQRLLLGLLAIEQYTQAVKAEAVVLSAMPKPTANPSPTPEATPAPTPKPTAAPTAVPSPTPTKPADATKAQAQKAKQDASAASGEQLPTPGPTAKPAAKPVAKAVAKPKPTATPIPTPRPVADSQDKTSNKIDKNVIVQLEQDVIGSGFAAEECLSLFRVWVNDRQPINADLQVLRDSVSTYCQRILNVDAVAVENGVLAKATPAQRTEYESSQNLQNGYAALAKGDVQRARKEFSLAEEKKPGEKCTYEIITILKSSGDSLDKGTAGKLLNKCRWYFPQSTRDALENI